MKNFFINFNKIRAARCPLSTRPQAFTLIEAIMVIVVVGIISVSVMASVNTQWHKLTAAANRLAFDLRYAQQLAINRHTSCGISFDPSGNSYFVYLDGSTSNVATDPYTKQTFSIDYDTDSKYAGVNLASTNFGNDISFDYLGDPYDSTGTALSSQGTIVLRYDSERRRVRIIQRSGSIKITS